MKNNSSFLFDKDGYMAILRALLPLDLQFDDGFVSDDALLERLAAETKNSLSSYWDTFDLAYRGMLQNSPMSRNKSIDKELGEVKSAWRRLQVAAQGAKGSAGIAVSMQWQNHTYVGVKEGRVVFLHPVEKGDESISNTEEDSVAKGLPDSFFNLSILSESDGKGRLNNFLAGSQMGPALLKSAAGLLAAFEKGNKVDQEADGAEKAASSAFAGLSLSEKGSSTASELPSANRSAITIGGRPHTVVTIESLPSKWGASEQSLVENLNSLVSILKQESRHGSQAESA
jgi:hypothetical protein